MNQETISDDYINESTRSQILAAQADDSYLIGLIVDRNEEAFAELFHRFNGMLFNFLMSLVGDRPAAEDLLQEVFLAVWKGAGRYRGAASVKTWLFNIAYYQGISWRRKRRELLVEDSDRVMVDSDPLQSDLERWHSESILDALEQLSPQHRAVVEMILYYGMSYRQAADVLDCPVGTVKSRLSYARRRIQALVALQDRASAENAG